MERNPHHNMCDRGFWNDGLMDVTDGMCYPTRPQVLGSSLCKNPRMRCLVLKQRDHGIRMDLVETCLMAGPLHLLDWEPVSPSRLLEPVLNDPGCLWPIYLLNTSDIVEFHWVALTAGGQ